MDEYHWHFHTQTKEPKTSQIVIFFCRVTEALKGSVLLSLLLSKAAAHSPETVLVQKGLAAHPFFGGVQGATLSSRNVWDLRI